MITTRHRSAETTNKHAVNAVPRALSPSTSGSAIPFRPIGIMAFVAVLAGLAVSACAGSIGDTFASGTWRYRMTVEVETPEGIKTGSAVREVQVQNGIKLTPESIPQVTLKGEAVAVDLGKRGVLFALLTGPYKGPDYGADILWDVFPPPAPALSPEGIRFYSQLTGVKATLTPQQYPTFARFRNLMDPKTIEQLSTSSGETITSTRGKDSVKTFDSAFGAGVRLISITIEMTTDVPTSTVLAWLPWLPEYYSKMFDGLRYNSIRSQYPFANSMSAGAFKAGEVR